MATVVSQVTRLITIVAKAVGVDQTTASMQKLADSENNVAVANENVSKSTLSMQGKLNSLQRQLDVNYRSQQSLANATKTISGARAQGLVDATEEARLLDLARRKYTDLAPTVEHVTEKYALNRMQIMELTHSGRAMFDMIAAGQSPLRALELESLRLGQALGSGQGGVMGALRGLAPILLPIAGALAVVSLGVAALTSKLNQGKPVALSFFDTIKGVAVTAWGAVKTEFDKAPDWMRNAWDKMGTIVGDAVNNMIQQFAIFAAQINTTFKNLPDDVMLGIQNVGNTVIDWLNKLTDGVNALGRALARLSGQTVAEPTAAQIASTHIGSLGLAGGAAADEAKNNDALNKRIAQIMGTNYLPQIYSNGLPKATGTGTTDKFAKMIDTANASTAALNAESAALGMNTYNATKLEEQTKLLNEAQKDGIKLSPSQISAINATAEAYAAAKAKLESLTEAYNTGKEVFTSLFSNLYSNLKQGEDFWSAFKDAALSALDTIAQKMIEVTASNAFDALWSGGFGGGGGSSGGGLGSIISGLLGLGTKALGGGEFGGFGSSYATGGYTGQGGMYEPAGIVHRGEYVFDAAATSRIGVSKLNSLRGYASGGLVGAANSNGGVVIHNHIDARGGELGVETKIANAMHGLLRYQIPAAIEQHQRNGSRRGYWPTPPITSGSAA